MENKVEELQEEKKKGNSGLIILVVLLFVVCAIMGAFIFVNKDKLTTTTNTKEEKIEKLETTSAVKEKLERFIIIASHFDGGNTNTTLDKFIDGATSISKEVKLKMARNAVYQYGNVYQNITITDEELINKLDGEKPDVGEIVDIIKKEEYDKRYKELFNEEAAYEFSELKNTGCPAPMSINQETGEMYLYHRCGGTGILSYDMKVTNYDSDEKYYYATEEIVETNIATKETKKTILAWKFDKDYNFVEVETKN